MRVTHVFVDSFPEPLEQGRLYVSMRYASVAHLCACGCGNEVVTPIRKRGWKLTFDGESISLSPSVGNHNLACQSHYFIRENEIRWAGRLSWEEIQEGRAENHQGGISYDDFGAPDIPEADEVPGEETMVEEEVPSPEIEPETHPRRRQWWERFLFWK